MKKDQVPIMCLHSISRIISDKHPGKKVIFTDGVFDTYHSGHAEYIRAAKDQGDILIVGIHSDSLTKKRKGQDRPLFSFEERLNILSDNQNIDFLIEIKDQNFLYDLIRKLRPNILVVSESTEDIDNCPKTMDNLFSTYVEKIIVFKPFSTRHSTDLIQNLKEIILEEEQCQK